MPVLTQLLVTFRHFRRSPVFTGLVVATLAVGIGATTLVFSIADGLVLNPFPYREPNRLVGVGSAYPKLNSELGFWEHLSPPEYLDIASTPSSRRWPGRPSSPTAPSSPNTKAGSLSRAAGTTSARSC